MKKYLFFLILFVVLMSCRTYDYPEPGDLGIEFSAVTELDDGMNTYCLFPVEFGITLRNRNYVRYIDSMFVITPSETYKVDLKRNPLRQTAVFADTGEQKVTLRVYELEDKNIFYDTSLFVRAAINYSGRAVDTTLGRDGLNIALRAAGSKHESADWFWDLSGIGLGIIRAAGDTSIFVNNGAEGEIYLSQINSAGIRTPNVAIPFNARHYAVGDLSFTVSRISSEFNAYVLHPITVTANLSQADLAHIDSVVLLLPSSAVLPRINLLPSNNFTGNISFTDTGSYLCEARIFGMMDGTAYRDTSFVVRVGVIGDVPLTVTPVNNRFDGYALAPISIVASPRQADRDYIDSIVIFLPNGAISQSQRISLLPSNNFTGSVTFADTGNYISEARIYGATGNAFRETSLNIRAGVDFGIAGDLKFEVEDTGDDILLRAVGYKADGVYWEWGLSRIRAGLGNRRTMADTVIVNFAGRAATDTLFLSQVKLDTVAGIPQEYRIQRAFIYTASIKMYSVNIEVVGDAKVVFNPGTSFSVTSGATSRISYIFALGTTRSFLTRVDSVTVNGERLALDIRNMGGTSSIGDYTAGLFDVNHIRSNLDIKFYAQIALRLRLRWPTRTLNWSYDTRNESGAPGWGFSNAFAGEIWGGEAVFNQYLAGWSLGSTIPDTELFDCAISRRMVFTTNKKLDRNAVWEFVYNDGNNERVLERPMGEGGLVAVAAAPISGDYYDNFLGKLVDDDLSWTGTNNVEAYIIQLEPDNASLKAVRARFVDAATGQQIIVTFNTIWGPVPWGPSGGCSATESSGFNYITGQSVGFNGPLYPNGPNVYNFVEIR